MLLNNRRFFGVSDFYAVNFHFPTKPELITLSNKLQLSSKQCGSFQTGIHDIKASAHPNLEVNNNPCYV